MRFRVLSIFCLNLLAIPLAGADPFDNCPSAFEQMFPKEIARASREMPELAFLPPEKIHQVHKATLILASGGRDFSHVSTLKEAVDYLQTERRTRFKRLDRIRATRRNKRKEILSDKISEAEKAKKQDKKNQIDEEIKGLQNELTALTGHLVPMRNQLGRMTIEAAANSTAKKTDTLILLRNTLINAAGQLAHKGVGKGLSVKFHSAQDGAIAGLIPYQQRLSAKVMAKGPAEVARMQKLVDEALEKGEVIKIKFRVGTLAAVERDGKVVFVNYSFDHIDENEIVEVIGVFDEIWEPRLLVSDVDPLAFGRRSDLLPEIPAESPTHGVVTPSERDVIGEYNHQASQLLDRQPEQTFMAHGAENRNPNSSGVSGYPITAHYPNGKMVVIEQGPADDPDLHLKAFYKEAANEGFYLEVNPLWGWPEDLPVELLDELAIPSE